MNNEYELIDEVVKGNVKAFDELLKQNYRLIYKIIYSLNLRNGDFMADVDDLYQEGCLALYNACFCFKKDKGVKFTSFAYNVIRNRIKTTYRDSFLKHSKETYSLDVYENMDYQMNYCVSDNPLQYHREEEFKRQLDSFLNNLSSEEAEILRLRQNSYSYKEIAERMNINIKKVDNCLYSLKNKLRKYLKDSGNYSYK